MFLDQMNFSNEIILKYKMSKLFWEKKFPTFFRIEIFSIAGNVFLEKSNGTKLDEAEEETYFLSQQGLF